MNRYVLAFAILCVVYRYTVSESQVQNRIGCIRGRLPPKVIQSMDTCCTKQEKGCSARWGYFRTAMLCSLNATTTATGQAEFDGVKRTCSTNTTNKNAGVLQYKINDCIVKDYERKCTTRPTTTRPSG